MLLTMCPLVSLSLLLLGGLGAALGYRLLRGSRTFPKDTLYGVLLLFSSTGLILSVLLIDWILDAVLGPRTFFDFRVVLVGVPVLVFTSAVIGFALDWLFDRRPDAPPPQLPADALDQTPAPRAAAPTGVFRPSDAVAPPPPGQPRSPRE